jgi:hypothetical protein
VHPVSEQAKVKLALVEVLELPGPFWMVVSGGMVSTVKLQTAGVGSVFPAESTALTSKV